MEATDAASLIRARHTKARAKVNLTLEIKGKRADSYHELESLVLFADFGDELTLDPASEFSLSIEGPFAQGLEASGNLVEKAARAFAAQFGLPPGGRFRLVKRIPVAAGLGGGSADAAAALRLLSEHHEAPENLEDLIPLARKIGSDVPCCLFSRAAIMTGIGEKLYPLPPISAVPAVLANPLAPLSTADVFRALAAPPLAEEPCAPRLPGSASLADLVAHARNGRNDLEATARRLMPAIGDILSALEAAPGSLISRLSGSGPSCFALFETHEAAWAAAQVLRQDHSDWWVEPVLLR